MTLQNAQIRAALSRTRVISGWPEPAIIEFCAEAELKTYRDGERALSTGQKIDSIWIVAEGSFLMSRSWQNGRRFVYSFLSPGQMTGVLPVFDGQPAAFDATARGDATAIIVPGKAVRSVVQKFPEAAREIVVFLCRRARMDYEAIELHAMNSVRCRIAKALLWIARGQSQFRGGEADEDPKISQEELADIVCAARQSVNRELRRLMREGIIKQRYRALAILDRDRLLHVAGEDEALSSHAHQLVAARDPQFSRRTD